MGILYERRFLGRENKVCEETDEIKESHVAGVKKGEAWRRALNERKE